MALSPEMRAKIHDIISLTIEGRRLQELQATGGSHETSLGLLQARRRYEAAFVDIIHTLVVDYGYTQLAHGSILTLNRFDDELFFDVSETESISLPLFAILSKVQTETPEADVHLLENVSLDVHIINGLTKILDENARTYAADPDNNKDLPRVKTPPGPWTLSHKGKVLFHLDPVDESSYQPGWYPAATIRDWVCNIQSSEPNTIFKKTSDISLSVDYPSS